MKRRNLMGAAACVAVLSVTGNAFAQELPKLE